ncbi:MAG: nicotinate phosphoribosyltransferase [Candidatus Onthovivens sp.]|nr:nicotinate phosphoribosyltransferase [Candidatus Onthovivens sp.]MDY5984493.1 nicotinate phosphoribosyltransferase [Candidatus Onthovivens sp.]
MDIKRNITLLMDFYELTMSNGYFINNLKDDIAVFDLFYRKNPDDAAYSIFVGLEDIINYILNLHFDDEDINYLKSLNIFNDDFLNYLRNFKFSGDLYAFKEGSIVYPNVPLVTVVAPLIDCQLLETALLATVNHETLIATKANRIVLASKGRSVSDFGARRAHNIDSALYGAKAAYIGGVNSTATTLAGQLFNIPVSGTMAHSWVMAFDSEYEAFLSYAKLYPSNTILLIDTYDVINSGLKNAIKVAKDYLIPNGYKLKGVRIDSGDLAYLSKKTRKILDENGLNDTIIIASNSLDEYKISSLIEQGAKLDSFGVGENLITSKSDPVFGGVYKLAGIYKNNVLEPKIKISATLEKITNPSFKEVYRLYNEENKAIGDLLTLKDEIIDENTQIVDPLKPWKKIDLRQFKIKKMHHKIFEKGKLIYEIPSILDTRNYVRYQIDNELWDEEKRFVLPHTHYLDFSKALYDLKIKLIEENKYE